MRKHTENRFESACPPFAEQDKGGEDLWHARAKARVNLAERANKYNLGRVVNPPFSFISL